jgi:hypothetical protein
MTWIERLREWLASELLQPLAHHITTAHELPNQAIAARAPNAKVCLEGGDAARVYFDIQGTLIYKA